MSWEMQSAAVASVKSGGTAHTFTFSDKVQACLIAPTAFFFSYCTDDGAPGDGNSADKEVKKLWISLSPNKPSGNTVTVTVYGAMYDGSGNSSDQCTCGSNRGVGLVALAWTGSDLPSNVFLGSQDNVSSETNGTISGIRATGQPYMSAGVMKGFVLSYGADEHQIHQIYAGVGAPGSISNGSVSISSDAGMTNGHVDAQEAATDIGYIMESSEDYHLIAKQVNDIQKYNSNYSVDFSDLMPAGTKLKQVCSMLTKFSVSFPDDDQHDLLNIGVGAWGSPWNFDSDHGSWTIADNTAQIDTAFAGFSDSRDLAEVDGQDNSASGVSLLVLAIVESTS